MAKTTKTPPSFKHTKIGWIPMEWQVSSLGDFIKIMNGNSPVHYSLNLKGLYPFVKVEDLNNNLKHQEYSREFTNDNTHLIPEQSIIFPKRGAAINNNKVRIAAKKIVIDSNLMAINVNKNSTEYVYYVILYSKLYRIADTSTIPQINNKHIKPFKIPLPPLPEQKLIAACLSVWDKGIATEQKLIEKLQLRKKGLMQQLLTGKKRLRVHANHAETHTNDVHAFTSTTK